MDMSVDKNIFIYGENNQGKTNFLEALYFLGNGLSPRESNIINLVSFDQEESVLGINLLTPNQSHRLYARLTAKGTKSFILDEKPIRQVSRLFKTIPITYVSADVIRLFQDSPEERRRCLDRFWSQYNPQYGGLLRKFKAVLKQKNKCLELPSNHHQLDLWNEQFFQVSEKIVLERMNAIDCLNKALIPLVKDIMTDVSDVKMTYTVKGLDPAFMASDYGQYLKQKCEENRMKEIQSGRTLYGPQRDDFEIFINGKSIFSFYSRGD